MNEHDAVKLPARRPPSRLIVGFVALVVLIGAGAAIWSSAGEDIKHGIAQLKLAMSPKPPVPPAQPPMPPAVEKVVPLDDEDDAFWSEVSIYKSGPGRPLPIVAVERGAQPTSGENYAIYQGLLAREIVRQGLLLSAREELGALTRDVPIGDPKPEGEPDLRFRIGSQFIRQSLAPPGGKPHATITIVRGEGEAREVLWAERIDYLSPISPNYDLLPQKVEEYSRKEFRELFEKLGMKRVGKALARQKDGPLSAKIVASLDQPTETEQYSAIRALHAEIRRAGESRTLLDALARAYAQLGSLAEAQWTADSCAYRARGLLYARRALSIDDENAEALSELAYVEAVVGLFRESGQHFVHAEEAGIAGPDPDRIRMIRAYITSDCRVLERMAAEKPDMAWPAYFRFLSLTRSSGYIDHQDWINRHEIIGAGREVLKVVPDNYRVYEEMAELGGVSNLHRATTEGQALFAEAVPRRLTALEGLPERVALLVDDGAIPDEVQLRKALDESATDDDADLTWGVLARQFREIRFAQAGRRLDFLVDWLNVSPADFAEQVGPILADHPKRAYFALYAGGDLETAKQVRALDLADMPLQAEKMLLHLRMIDPVWSMEQFRLAASHVEEGTVPGQAQRLTGSRGEDVFAMANNLLKYDPHSPLARGAWIFAKAPLSEADARFWSKDHGGSDTFVLGCLGLRKLEEGKVDEAQPLLEAALARSPELWIFEGLASVYLQTGDIDRWIAAVNDFVKTEDMALDHSQALAGLARFLMAKGDYKRAWPFVEQGAESGSGNSMLLAAKCAEGLEDWDEAERWVRQLSQRYGNSWMDWVYWCKRTGHGDAMAAMELVDSQIAQGRTPDSEQEWHIAMLHMQLGQPEKAMVSLKRQFDESGDTTIGALLAAACDLAGDKAGRDAALKAVGENPKPSGPKTAKIMKTIGEWLAKGDPDGLDMAALNASIEDLTPAHWPNTCAILGILLDRNGKQDAAKDCFERANSNQGYAYLRFFALDALRARGMAPESFGW